MTTELLKEEFAGIYIAPEAALYLTATLKRDLPTDVQVYKVNSRSVIRWIRHGFTSPELKQVAGRELIMSFEDLISMRVVALLRSLGISWQKIYRAEQWLREQTGYPRPFAVEKVWTETSEIFADLPVGFIAASRRGQLVFTELIGQYLQPVEDMSFVRRNGINVAATWVPHTNVIMNPKVQFGDPCIEGTRIRTRIMWQMWNGGDSISYLTRAFELKIEQIENAIEWEKRLRAVKKIPILSSRQ